MAEWDQSHDWVVFCREWHRADLTIVFDTPRPSVHELAALRRCLPDFRDLPPAEALARAGTAGRMELPDLPGQDARRLAENLRQAGLKSVLRNTSAMSYLFMDETTGHALLVEDEHEAERLAREMMAAGVRVERIESTTD